MPTQHGACTALFTHLPGRLEAARDLALREAHAGLQRAACLACKDDLQRARCKSGCVQARHEGQTSMLCEQCSQAARQARRPAGDQRLTALPSAAAAAIFSAMAGLGLVGTTPFALHASHLPERW
jgi:anti-sigma factor RsiW